MAATCSYAVSQSKEHPGAMDLADHFCQVTSRAISERFKSLCDNDDKSTNAIAKRVIDKEFTWLEKGIIPAGPETP